jgi:hypothetical protein
MKGTAMDDNNTNDGADDHHRQAEEEEWVDPQEQFELKVISTLQRKK